MTVSVGRGLLWAVATFIFLCVVLGGAGRANAEARSDSTGPATIAIVPKVVHIPKISQVPQLGDFEGMEASGVAKEMAKLTGFIQRNPSDGAPATERTDVYLAYGPSDLYVAWVCFDDPSKVRAHLLPRGSLRGEDTVQLTVDTFHDQRHGFIFASNALGVQNDGLWNEPHNADYSFDTVWDTQAHMTLRGYVVLMVIPFRSLRFPSGGEGWGFTLSRNIPRKNETDYWPRVSSRIAGRLNQEAVLTGIEGISPPHNYQFNPYVSFRSFRALDTTDSANPRFASKTAQFKEGMDSKFVFHNSLVLDATINPDFSQVESDQPQNTANQRFEVFYPEKRPFFLENSNLFEAAGLQYRLVFTRRIANPEYGLRLTGKQGPYSLAFMYADDRAPGEAVTASDPQFGKRAEFFVAHVTRDIGEQSNVGLVYTDREFFGGWNRVGGLDGLWKFNQNWTLAYRAVVSSTLHTDGTYSAGPLAQATVNRYGRQLNYGFDYEDVSPGFETQVGFVRRNDIRHIGQHINYSFRPEGKHLIAWGPGVNADATYDHNGTLISYGVNGNFSLDFSRQTSIGVNYSYRSDTLRPKDFSGLTQDMTFLQNRAGMFFSTQPFRWLRFRVNINDGDRISVVPPDGQLPRLGNDLSVNNNFTLIPTSQLKIDGTYILDRLKANHGLNAAYNNDIFRARVNYQFTRKLSMRLIGQYNGLLADPLFTSLQTKKNMNFDLLFTYLVHPGTAVYLGYNSNLQNLDPQLCSRLANGTCDPNNSSLLRTPGSFINDGRQIYLKISYLFRP